MFFLLVGEDIASLTLEECWDIKDLYGTCVRTAHLWATACRQLDEAELQLGEAQQRVHQLSGEIIQARELAASREEELLLLQGTLSYRIGNRLCRLRSQLAPEPTWRYRLYRLVRRAAQTSFAVKFDEYESTNIDLNHVPMTSTQTYFRGV
jgi:hypothetical protein